MIDPRPAGARGRRQPRAALVVSPRVAVLDGVPTGASAALALLAVALGWRGADLPAALYRINDFRLRGFQLWDSQWYGGHHALGWSVLLPPVGAVLGPALTGVGSALVATWLFAGLARRHLGRAALAASVVFAAGTVVNQAVGRLPFSLGLAIGLGAVVVGLERRRWPWGVGLAVATTLASPVAGAFVALAAGAWALTEVRRPSEWRLVRCEGVAVAFGAAAPIAVVAVAFPDGGRFPFRGAAYLCLLLVCLGLWLAVPRADAFRAVRVGIVLYAFTATAVFVVPNPMGANVVRLGTVVGAPLAVAALWGGRRWIAVIVAGGLLWWHWSPALDSMLHAGRDPSASAGYFAPLVGALEHAGAGDRVEIPFTRHHWETVYVPDHAPLARGWERQLDLRYNDVLYTPALDAATYHQWLLDNAVRFVALPDVEIDASSAAEAAILATPPSWLRPVWHDAHWRLWEVADARPVADRPARLLRSDDVGFALDVPSPGSYVVRIHHSPRFSVGGDGEVACVSATPDGWTRVVVRRPGLVEVSVSLRSAPDSACPAT
ncbi:MAG TPA: hypothetical protein VHN98_03280 [Acidimicrobiales bacterium]|nr:hypothetical protein [Acidimicrobiales bacterium]